MAAPLNSTVKLMRPLDLYNLLNLTSYYRPLVATNVNHVLLLDVRPLWEDYELFHIFMARRAVRTDHGAFDLPDRDELCFKEHIVVYDTHGSDTAESIARPPEQSDDDDENEKPKSLALECAQFVQKLVTGWPVAHKIFILSGGFKQFCHLYPYMRTNEYVYSPRDLERIISYPLEIAIEMPDWGRLYFGSIQPVCCPQAIKCCQIEAFVNCTGKNLRSLEQQPLGGSNLLTPNLDTRVRMNTSEIESLASELRKCCEFIDQHIKAKRSVLIFSTFGRNKSAAVAIAYLIYLQQITWHQALQMVQRASPYIVLDERIKEALECIQEHYVTDQSASKSFATLTSSKRASPVDVTT